jgi:hypothetical protein
VGIIGAAAALRERNNVPVAPSERPGYERLLANCREMLNDAAFDAAWQSGRALSWEQAVDEALAATER